MEDFNLEAAITEAASQLLEEFEVSADELTFDLEIDGVVYPVWVSFADYGGIQHMDCDELAEEEATAICWEIGDIIREMKEEE